MEMNMELMYQEAKERMELLQISPEDIDSFFVDKEITKIDVDHENLKIIKGVLNDEEKEMVRQIEQEKEFLVYYLIKDEGLLLDGCSFARYTVLFVDKYKLDYENMKESIREYRMVPAYVINQEIPEYAEITFFGYRNVDGTIINIT